MRKIQVSIIHPEKHIVPWIFDIDDPKNAIFTLPFFLNQLQGVSRQWGIPIEQLRIEVQPVALEPSLLERTAVKRRPWGTLNFLPTP